MGYPELVVQLQWAPTCPYCSQTQTSIYRLQSLVIIGNHILRMRAAHSTLQCVPRKCGTRSDYTSNATAHPLRFNLKPSYHMIFHFDNEQLNIHRLWRQMRSIGASVRPKLLEVYQVIAEVTHRRTRLSTSIRLCRPFYFERVLKTRALAEHGTEL